MSDVRAVRQGRRPIFRRFLSISSRILTHPIVGGACHLLGEAHEQQVRPLLDPFRGQLLFCGASEGVVGRLQTAEQLRERIVYFGGNAGHIVGRCFGYEKIVGGQS